MKIKTEDLLKAFDIVYPALDKRRPDTQRIVFTGDELVGYGGQISVAYPFESGFTCVVAGEEMYEIVKSIQDEDVELSLDKDRLLIKSKRTRLEVSADVSKGISDAASVVIQDGEKRKSLPLPKNFVEGIFLCLFSASRASGDVFNCLSVYDNYVVSSDDLRISRYTLDKPIKYPLLIPLNFAVILANLPVERFSISENVLHFKTKDGVIVSFTTFVGDYPNAEVVDNLKVEGKALELPNELRDVLKKISIMAEGTIDLDKVVTIQVKSDRITVRGEKELGWAEQDVDFKFKGKGFSFRVSPVFLSQVMAHTTNMTLAEGKAYFRSENFEHIMALPMEEPEEVLAKKKGGSKDAEP